MWLHIIVALLLCVLLFGKHASAHAVMSTGVEMAGD